MADQYVHCMLRTGLCKPEGALQMSIAVYGSCIHVAVYTSN